ncbi:MAG: cupin fold metalloprotein, WbuC family [SAR202 cluster bacterium]|nr:cupin fold metalloprotein, WbuC family [SAR202 cluster bacterium]|tara:strand:- start:285 stop:842 length:558 start_codon:yes stop_codon:yes gene_type:complete
MTEPLIRTKQINEEVLYTDERIVRIGQKDVASLKNLAKQNSRKRVRLCAHLDVEDGLHEMFIIHTKDTYVRPHKHLNKSESINVLEGAVDLVIFDETGNIKEVTKLGDYASGNRFYHRLSDPTFHTLVIRSDTVAFHEITSGPFKPDDTVWASWAPISDSKSSMEASQFLASIRQRIEGFLRSES